MTTLYRWGLEAFRGGFRAYGHVYGHRDLTDGRYICTSLIQDAAVVDDQLVLETQSGTVYTLWPEDIRPKLRPDSVYPDAWKEALACLSSFGIDAGFAEHCVQARIDVDVRRRAEEERILEPGELLLEVAGLAVLTALFRTADGELREVKRQLHGGLHQDSVLITDWECGTVDFRYFPRNGRIEPYHISDGLHTIKVYNLGRSDTFFGREEKKVACKAGAITAIPAAEHDEEWLFSPDAVNGKGLYQTLLGGRRKRDEPTQ